MNIVYIILALLGVGFLIFIHELGHYFTAIRNGIKVEVFSIGFGKPLLQWKRGDVIWKICILPFGGYVKMAGMEKEGNVEPSEIEHGFFGAKPWSQIKVAFAGPLVNIVFAFVAFSLLWMVGGRYKPFAEFTKYIGYVNTDSKVYESGIRAGDEILKLNDRPFRNFHDFLYGAALDDREMVMQGNKISYFSGSKKSFTYTFDRGNLGGLEKAGSILETLSPAQYLIYNPAIAPHMKLPDSPLKESGILANDRIIWVDGKLIFSNLQLAKTVNEPMVLLTVERNGETFLARIPRLQVSDLRLSASQKAEIEDWGYELKTKEKIENLYYIPYNLTRSGAVQGPYGYIDEEAESKMAFEPTSRTHVEKALQRGDKIIAVQGEPIENALDLFNELQTKKTLILVKNAGKEAPISWKAADKGFEASFDIKNLKKIIQTVGTESPVKASGSLRLLNPVTPVKMKVLPLTEKQDEIRAQKIEKYKESIEEIQDPDEKDEAEEKLEKYQNRMMLGLAMADRKVVYNPSPFLLFVDVFKEIYRTLYALITGYLSPKNLAGPVGMIQIIHHGWTVGIKEALFWLGMISLNLGILNLLPIPILDGGHICFAAWEWVTGKKISAKTREKFILPFFILIIGLAIYLTYNDISRIFTHFFK